MNTTHDLSSVIAELEGKLKEAISTLEKRLVNEEAEKHAIATRAAELEAKIEQLMKQISNESQVDYKGLSLKERIKVCVDIIFA